MRLGVGEGMYFLKRPHRTVPQGKRKVDSFNDDGSSSFFVFVLLGSKQMSIQHGERNFAVSSLPHDRI